MSLKEKSIYFHVSRGLMFWKRVGNKDTDSLSTVKYKGLKSSISEVVVSSGEDQ